MLSVGEAGSLAHKNNLSFTPLSRQVGIRAPLPFVAAVFLGRYPGAWVKKEPPFRVTLSVKPKRLSLFRHSNASPCGEEPLNGTGTWLSCAKACSRNSCKMGHPQNPKSHGS